MTTKKTVTKKKVLSPTAAKAKAESRHNGAFIYLGENTKSHVLSYGAKKFGSMSRYVTTLIELDRKNKYTNNLPGKSTAKIAQPGTRA